MPPPAASPARIRTAPATHPEKKIASRPNRSPGPPVKEPASRRPRPGRHRATGTQPAPYQLV